MKTVTLGIAALIASSAFALAGSNSTSNSQMVAVLPAPGHVITVDGIKCVGSIFDRKVWCPHYGYVVVGQGIPGATFYDGYEK